MKNILLLISLFISSFAFSQTGINTINPQATLHVDGAKDNPATGTPSTAQQINDFVVTAAGNIGVGITTPTAKLQVRSGTNGISGLKFDNVNNATATTSSTALLGIDASGNVVIAASAITGDIKNSVRTADHNGWYLLDGRAISSLPANAQTAATALGFASTIPNATDRFLKTKTGSETIGNTGGNNSLTILQTNLPNVTFTGSITGSTSTAGSHTHTVERPSKQADTDRGTAASSWSIDSLQNGATTPNGDHTHTVSGTATVSSGGSGTVLDNRSAYLIVNTYIYLGQ
ncbi:hypothetical protein FA048_10835 [Pedobacter polaris]|uniref:Phage tail collar domain-containing protein n=1 Tax=Pedobacter polaris TaxID=2571273 RepID=A0A4U1CSD1_9SPHI|nr:hypothetical protein [Pedobacter polaris]TKC10664.1 hypothetical protein FA048_10835 [Pedobacter polaris]